MKLREFMQILYRLYPLRSKRPYPRRMKETCVCGREITKCKNGRFQRHNCNPVVSEATLDVYAANGFATGTNAEISADQQDGRR